MYLEEEWKDIIIEKNGILYDYSGMYQVSNLGRVRSLDRVNSQGHRIKGKILSTRANNHGYKVASFFVEGKAYVFSVHRLVANAFIPNQENLPVVNHIDENPLNNCVDNLEWCTVQYNTKYSSHKISKGLKGKYGGEKNPMYGRTGSKNPTSRKVVCVETKQVFECIRQAQDWLGKGCIKHCVRGDQKTAGGYHWIYYEDYQKDLRAQTDIKNSKDWCDDIDGVL